MKKIALVWAMDKNWLIGDGDKLPWNFPEDLKHFKEITRGKAVLMGSKTYNSMKSYYKNKPFPFFITYVADKFNNKYDDAITITDAKWFLKNVRDELYVIGGASIYNLAVPYADELYITHIDGEYSGDTYIERFEIDNMFELESSVVSGPLTMNKYVRKNKEAWSEFLRITDMYEDGLNDSPERLEVFGNIHSKEEE